jgi:hypothetical protein
LGYSRFAASGDPLAHYPGRNGLGFGLAPGDPRFDSLRRRFLEIYLANLASHTDLIDGADVLVDLVGRNALLFGTGGDLVVHLGYRVDRVGDRCQGFAGAGGLIDALFCSFTALSHDSYCLAGAVLQLFDHRLDLAGGLLRASR